MEEISNSIFCIIVFIAGLGLLYVKRNFSNTLEKNLLYFFITSITIYSGLGISYISVDNVYILYYLLFLILFLSSYSMIQKITMNNHKLIWNKRADIKGYADTFSSSFDKYQYIVWFLFLCYILCCMLEVIYPSNQIKTFFSPWTIKIDITDIFTKIEADSILTTIIYYAKLLLLPFYFICLNQFAKEKKYLKVILSYLLPVYTEFIKNEYIARNMMVTHYIILIFLVYYTRYGCMKMDRKMILLIVIPGILVTPALIAYQYLRMGVLDYSTSIGEALQMLLDAEIGYPMYFSRIAQTQWEINGLDYILYLLFLFIPSAIWPAKPSIAINNVFSQAILGVSRGRKGFYIVLPSLLGEAMILYGNIFYWIHAIVLGIVLGIIIKYIKQIDCLRVLFLYYAVTILTMGRGGSQGYMAPLITGIFSLLVWYFCLKMKKKKI